MTLTAIHNNSICFALLADSRRFRIYLENMMKEKIGFILDGQLS